MEDAQKVQAYFNRLPEKTREIAKEMRCRIDALGPRLRVSMARGHPCWSGHQKIFSIIAQSGYCNLQLWNGAHLADEFSRIEGAGKALRHVKIRSLDALDEGFDDIVEAAIGLDR